MERSSQKNKPIRPEVYMLRKAVFDFYHDTVLPACQTGMRILEIGPMDKTFTPIEDFYISLHDYKDILSIEYKTCDIYEKSNADFICSALDLKPENTGKFDVIIACEVFEHINKIWEIPQIFHNLLNHNGKVFASSPFYFYLHNPFPDYWRISEYGYYELFENLFKIDITKTNFSQDDRKPINYQIVLSKKD